MTKALPNSTETPTTMATFEIIKLSPKRSLKNPRKCKLQGNIDLLNEVYNNNNNMEKIKKSSYDITNQRHLLSWWAWLWIFWLMDAPIPAQGSIIPPKWANVSLNPCSADSWQYLYWPEDGKCYKIFTKGPCNDYEEFHFDKEQNRPSCKCAQGFVRHHSTERCHQLYHQQPCDKREYLSIDGKGRGVCVKYKECKNGEIFWPMTNKCYPSHTQGPCLYGQLIHMDEDTGITKCSCDKTKMNMHHWGYGDTCHELYTRGPCVQGHIFIYNHTSFTTQCVCMPELVTNYHQLTKRCYELDTVGPCKPGQIFTFDSVTLQARCKCLDGYVMWEETGHCYREYTKGPCQPGQFIKPLESYRTLDQVHFVIPEYVLNEATWENRGECVLNNCKGGQLYDPQTKKCYPVGHRGPCSFGKLWIYERATSLRGICHCDPQLVGYWEPDNACYQIGQRGPCSERKILSYDLASEQLECKCDQRQGFVKWRNQCVKISQNMKPNVPRNILRYSIKQNNSLDSAAALGDDTLVLRTSQEGLVNLDLEEDQQSNIMQKSEKDPPPSSSSLVTDSYSIVTINNVKVDSVNGNKIEPTRKRKRHRVKVAVNKEPRYNGKKHAKKEKDISVLTRILSILFTDDNDDFEKKTKENKSDKTNTDTNKLNKDSS